MASKWIYKLKDDSIENELVKYKARLVAKKCSYKKKVLILQKKISIVVKYKIIRIMLSLVAQFNFESKQIDVKTTFLNGEGYSFFPSFGSHYEDSLFPLPFLGGSLT